MTLKELRISKGLSQSECAGHLGMTTRNYQNYENDPHKVNTAKYNAVYHKLEAYGFPAHPLNTAWADAFRTNVIVGNGIKALARTTERYEKRDSFTLLKQFVTGDTDGRIAILYGLRRTGKTTLLFQMMNELPAEQCAYIKIKTTDNMSMLTRDLDTLYERGFRFVFIDEVTLMEDFIDTAALLSDLFATMGMKIVVSGTDSLGFAMANRDELYDRNVMIHTSYIPFREYSRLLGIRSIDSYIEYGGTLKMENMGFDDPEYTFDDVSFRDNESTRKYIDTSISRNIQHTLKNDRFGENFGELRELYDKGELTNVINRIVESIGHKFLLSVVEDKFTSHDFGSARQLLLHEHPAEAAHVLYDVDRDAIVGRLKTIIEVKEKSETSVKVTEEHLKKIKRYLFMLDLLVNCTERYETHTQTDYTLFAQPGMRFAIAKALIYSLIQDEYFVTRPEIEKAHIAEKILEDVKGRMMEDIVLLETSKASEKSKEVFKFRFDDGGEYDMVVFDRKLNNCKIYEIKHSDKIADRQSRYLRDDSRLEVISHRFGEIKGRYVIYRGKPSSENGIEYLNVEEYLKNL